MIARGAAALLDWYVPWRRRSLERATRGAAAIQETTLLRLVADGRHTAFGRAHGFDAVRSVADYQWRVPLRDYPASSPSWPAPWPARGTSRGRAGRATG